MISAKRMYSKHPLVGRLSVYPPKTQVRPASSPAHTCMPGAAVVGIDGYKEVGERGEGGGEGGGCSTSAAGAS